MAGIPDNIVAILGTDNAGNVVSIESSIFRTFETVSVQSVAPTPIAQTVEPAKTLPVPVTIPDAEPLIFTADPNYIPQVNSVKDNLINSILYQRGIKMGVNTITPQFTFDVYGGSINVTPLDLKDGYRINRYLMAWQDITKYTLYLGDSTFLKIVDVNSLLISGLALVTSPTTPRVLSIDDTGLVSTLSLTSGSVIFSNGVGLVQDNAAFFWDATNKRLGIGNKVPTEALHVTGSIRQSVVTTAILKADSTGKIVAGIDGTDYLSPTTLTDALVTGKLLTGLNATGSDIQPTDSILVAFGKLKNQINGLTGALVYQGVWDASAGTAPTLTPVKGYYYKVSVAGATNLSGITDWKVGDWVIYNGTAWDKVDNTDSVSTVNGYNGAVSLVTGDVPEGAGSTVTRLYYTDTRARLAISSSATGLTYTNSTGVFTLTTGYSIPTTTSQTTWDTAYANRITSLTTTGNSGASSLISNVLNIPTYTLAGLGGQASSANLTSLSGLTFASTSFVKMTAAGTFALDTNTYYLASNPSGYTTNTGTVTSVSVTTANGVSGSVATNTTTPAITLTLGAITPTTVNGIALSGTSTPTLAVTGTSSISGSNTGDNAVNSLYSGLVSNATHTGDATGATALTVVALRGVALPTLTAVGGLLKYTGTGTNTWVFDTSTYLTGITSGQVTTALGYTPYNSTNPSGYISGNQSITLSGDVSGTGTTAITTTLATVTQAATGSFVKITLDTKGRVTGNTAVGSGDITTALGYTPYNSTNPNGYTSNTGTVTSVSGTGTVSGLTLTGTVTTTGSLTLGGTLAVTASNFASQTANTFLSAPNGAAGVPTFRAIVAADIPTLNQSTTGNASTATTLQTARNINGISFNGSADIIVPSIYDSAYTRISNPTGGVYTTQTPTITGAIAITLPVGMNNTMMCITIKVYEYVTNESFEIHAGGYAYTPGTTWANNPFAYIVGNPTVDRRFTVRFGYNSTTSKAIIYIGELASTWSYPQVFVTEFQGGYSGLTSTLTSGWTVGFEATAFQTVTATISNCQVGYATSTNTANAVVLRDGSGNFTAGTITAALTGNASTATTLQTARTFTIGATGKTFNGSANVSWTLAEIGAQAALGYTPADAATTITINGTTLSLAASSSFSVGTVTSVAALTIGSAGTDITSTVATSTTTPVITLNIPTASGSARGALSSTDWTTFNNKQAYLGGTGLVRSTAGNISYDTATYYLASNPSGYISGNQSITLSGDVSGTGTTAITTTLATITQAATGSFVKVTLDTKGRVTGNTAVIASDITTALTYTPVTNARTLTINGTTYDLTANRSWTIDIGTNVRNVIRFTATAGQTTFTITGGYTVGLVDVYLNGARLIGSDYTASNGTTVVLAAGVIAGDVIETVSYTSYAASSISGAGTTGYITKWTGSSSQGNSIIQESGSVITVGGSVTATSFSGAGTGLTGTASSLSIGGSAGSLAGIVEGRIVYGGASSRRGVNQITDWNQSTFPDAAFLSSESSTTNAPTTDFTYGVQTSFHRSGPDYRTQFVTSLYGNNSYWFRQLRDSAGWSSWVQVIHSGNYNSYSPQLNGTGATGTWGISISGNAATATTASSANSVAWTNVSGRPTALSSFTNDSGYITGITSGNVTTALGYTPYNATNPAGYITGITSGNVTTALGYTPYNATNPSGYITSSASITGTSSNITAYTINQNVGTTNAPTFAGQTINAGGQLIRSSSTNTGGSRTVSHCKVATVGTPIYAIQVTGLTNKLINWVCYFGSNDAYLGYSAYQIIAAGIVWFNSSGVAFDQGSNWTYQAGAGNNGTLQYTFNPSGYANSLVFGSGNTTGAGGLTTNYHIVFYGDGVNSMTINYL